MFNLISLQRVISTIAVSYAVLVTLVLFAYYTTVDSPSLSASIKIASGGALALDIAFLAAVHIWWKWLWAKFPSLNTLLFPNLNGQWSMTIHWIRDGIDGVANASATIKQDLLQISMEVKSDKSDSETMMAWPKKDPESGRPLLYYVYRVVPKQMDVSAGAQYEGAAILKFDGVGTGCLSGNYFTSQQTKGHFILKREQPSPAAQDPQRDKAAQRT